MSFSRIDDWLVPPEPIPFIICCLETAKLLEPPFIVSVQSADGILLVRPVPVVGVLLETRISRRSHNPTFPPVQPLEAKVLVFEVLDADL